MWTNLRITRRLLDILAERDLWTTCGQLEERSNMIELHPRLQQDIHKMSTDDLVLCLGALSTLARNAHRRGETDYLRVLDTRLAGVKKELDARQMTIEAAIRLSSKRSL